MKTLALVLTLVLHTTGLWPHLSEGTRAKLTTTGTASTATAVATEIQPGPIGPIPVRLSTQTGNVAASSAFAIDTATNTVLYSQDATARRPIASVTKLMTVLVVLSRRNPTDKVKVPQLPEYQTGAELIGLQAGETYTIGDLIRAALINSGNDAADALALIHSGTLPRFAAQMNIRAKEWGIEDTRFAGPSGLQDEGNYSTAQSLAKISQLALSNSLIRQTVTQSETTITSTAGRVLQLHPTNKLLATGQFYGIKTGYTPAAGECFVGLTRIQGHEVITVVLNAGARFEATQTLVNWIDRNYQWL